MLVLTRREGESILIGEDIKITVLGVTTGGIRVGIDAPREMRINRSEIVLAVSDENKVAAKSSADESAEAALLSALGRLGTPAPQTGVLAGAA